MDPAFATATFQWQSKHLHPPHTAQLYLSPLASCLVHPSLTPKPPSLCLSTSSSLLHSIVQVSPVGVRKLMALHWVLTINQAPISQAHTKLWTNWYTGFESGTEECAIWIDSTRVKWEMESRVVRGLGETVKLNLYCQLKRFSLWHLSTTFISFSWTSENVPLCG